MDTVVRSSTENHEANRSRTLPLMSSNPATIEDEEPQRIFYTRRDPRRVRTLKTLHLLPRTPSSVTYAEIGVQVSLQDPKPLEEAIGAQRNLLAHAMIMNNQNFREVRSLHQLVASWEPVLDEFAARLKTLELGLNDVEGTTSRLCEEAMKFEDEKEKLTADLNTSASELNECKSKLTKAAEDQAALEKEKLHFLSSVNDLQLETERLELDVAFLTEEKVDLETSLGEHKSLLDLVSQEKNDAQTNEEDLKSALLQTKISSAEKVGKYLDELNAVWAEKRKFIKEKLTKKSMPIELKTILSKTDRNLAVEEERNQLIDQVEMLSTQAVFQDLLLEQFRKHMSQLIRIRDGTEKGAARDLLINVELEKAKKLFDSEFPVFGILKKPNKKKEKGTIKTSSSLPTSPLVAAQVWSTNDLHTQRSPTEGVRLAVKQDKSSSEGQLKVTEGHFTTANSGVRGAKGQFKGKTKQMLKVGSADNVMNEPEEDSKSVSNLKIRKRKSSKKLILH